MTRAFVALALPERVQSGLARILEDLRVGRVVDEENLHLTLLFLDEQDDAALEEVHDTLSAIAEPAFDLTLSGLGTFGGARPRTLWLGVRSEPRLMDLQRSVARAARSAGLDLPRRRFVPHVTLSRLRDGEGATAPFTRFVNAHAGLTLPAFAVREFALFSSTLRSDGPVYEELAAYPLRPAGT